MSSGWQAPSGDGSDAGRQQPPQPRYGQYAPGYGPGQGQGDNTAQGYGAGPAYGTPQGYLPPQGYGPPSSYGPYGLHGNGAPGNFAMSPKPGVIPLRPLTLSDIFEGSFATIRGNPAATIGLALLVGVISLVPVALITWILSNVSLGDGTASDVGYTIVQFGGQFVSAIMSIVLAGMLTSVLSEAILGRRMSIGEAWRMVRPRILALLGVALLTFLAAVVLIAVVVGVIVALVAWVSGTVGAIVGVFLVIGVLGALVYVWVRLSLASPAVVLEKLGPVDGLKRSWRLSRGQFWRILGITVLAAIVVGLIASVLMIPFSFALIGAASASASASADAQLPLATMMAVEAVTLLVSAVLQPFSSMVTGLLYVDERIRKEGLDVTLMAATSDAR